MDIGVYNKLSELNETLKKVSIVGGGSTTNELLDNDIQGTTQTFVLNEYGDVVKIQHKDSSSVLIREDVFTYSDVLITEVRTKVSDSSFVTFKYHLDNSSVEII